MSSNRASRTSSPARMVTGPRSLRALGVDERDPQRQEPAVPAVRRDRPLPVHRQVRRGQLPLPLSAAPVAGSSCSRRAGLRFRRGARRRGGSWRRRGRVPCSRRRSVAGEHEAALPSGSGTKPSPSWRATRSTVTCAPAAALTAYPRRCGFIRRSATTRSARAAARRSPSTRRCLPASRGTTAMPSRCTARTSGGPKAVAQTRGRCCRPASTARRLGFSSRPTIGNRRGHRDRARRSPGTGKPVWAATERGKHGKAVGPAAVARLHLRRQRRQRGVRRPGLGVWACAAAAQRGQAGAACDRRVQVFVPKHAGADWADIWLARVANEAKAA